METTDILKKVRKIEIKTRGLSRNIFSGKYHSAFKGRGMTFSEVREYQIGDDVRQIDWNVTARFNHPYVKVFEEERELTFILIIDVSGSGEFGTHQQLKRNLITEISAVLAFSAIYNNDKVGVIFFSNKIEKYIPPKKGLSHILRIIRELLTFKPEHLQTNISQGLQFFTNVIKKRCTAFLISDFIDNGFDEAIKIASKKHDLIALKIYDIRETDLPPIGLIKLKDAESNETIWVNTSAHTIREYYKRLWEEKSNAVKEIFQKYGVDLVAIRTDEDYIPPLIRLFKKRGERR